jgi:hypothetical protein
MESETEYWRLNRETFLAKEGLPHVMTLSRILREEGTPYEGVVEELVGIRGAAPRPTSGRSE